LANKKEYEHKRQVVNFQLTIGVLSAFILSLMGYFVYGSNKGWALIGIIFCLFFGVIAFLSYNTILSNIEDEIQGN